MRSSGHPALAVLAGVRPKNLPRIPLGPGPLGPRSVRVLGFSMNGHQGPLANQGRPPRWGALWGPQGRGLAGARAPLGPGGRKGPFGGFGAFGSRGFGPGRQVWLRWSRMGGAWLSFPNLGFWRSGVGGARKAFQGNGSRLGRYWFPEGPSLPNFTLGATPGGVNPLVGWAGPSQGVARLMGPFCPGGGHPGGGPANIPFGGKGRRLFFGVLGPSGAGETPGVGILSLGKCSRVSVVYLLGPPAGGSLRGPFAPRGWGGAKIWGCRPKRGPPGWSPTPGGVPRKKGSGPSGGWPQKKFAGGAIWCLQTRVSK